MSHFELLPAELQIMIFSYLHRPDVKTARAVSRTFCNNATPVLFDSIVACARHQAMDAFKNVSLHSTYRTYVREFIFDGSDKIEKLRVLPWQGKHRRWKRYQTLYQDQEDMKTSGVLLQTISRGLECMPHVSSIVYSPHPHLIPVEAEVVRDLPPRTTFHYARYPSHQMRHGVASPNHAFRQLISAIYLSKYAGVRKFRVRKYKLMRDYHGTEFSLGIFEFPEPLDMEAGRHFFQHLFNLELHSALKDGHGSEETDPHMVFQQLTNLANLLVSAKDLRSLVFHITEWKVTPDLMYGDILPDNQPIFHHTGLRTTWQKLQSLSLKGLYANERDFTDLIERHNGTLRSLRFKRCSLCSGTWAEVVDKAVFNSMMTSFELDRVNEVDVPGLNWLGVFTSMEEKKQWMYEGHLVVSKDGKRKFVDTNPSAKSVYESRRW